MGLSYSSQKFLGVLDVKNYMFKKFILLSKHLGGKITTEQLKDMYKQFKAHNKKMEVIEKLK